MEKYTRVETSKLEESINKNEIRVTTQGKMRRYISYATNLLQEKQCEEITLKAMGKAINKTVAIAEIIKRRIPGLHQITEIDSTDIKETYTPTEEGLGPVETTRHVSSILISLFTHEPNTSALGYQPPIPDTEVKTTPTSRGNFTRRGGNRSRGGRSGGGRGRSRGRGRYSSPYPNYRGQGSRGESVGDKPAESQPSNRQPEVPAPEPVVNETVAEKLATEPVYNEGEQGPRGEPGSRGGRGRSRRGRTRGRGRGRGFRGGRGSSAAGGPGAGAPGAGGPGGGSPGGRKQI